MNIVEPIFAQCRNKASELALCAPGTELNLVSYARFERSVNSICRRVITAGILPKSRLAVVIEDPILHSMVVIALTRLGIITLSANDANVSWPIRLDGLIVDRTCEAPVGRTLLADVSWTADDGQPVAEKHLYCAAPDDLCRIVVTTASDGRQKAIALTHAMLAMRLDRQKLFLGPGAPFCHRTHLDLPLGTTLGFQVMLGTLWRGGAVLMTWDVRKTLAAIAAYNIQNVIATPQCLLKLVEALRSQPGYRSNLAAVFSAGSLKPELCERVRACLCSNLTVGYIGSDATMVGSMPAELASLNPGAAGYILPGIAVEVVGDDDRPLTPGQNGMEDPSATERDFRNGWFYPAARGHVTGEHILLVSTGTETRFTMPTPWTASVRSQ
jgi:2,3-dihydroxybenzoate-AMP ligase